MLKKGNLVKIMSIWLSTGIIILLAMGCMARTATLTPTSMYAHYVPPENSSVRLEFDHPVSWVWMQIDPQLISVEDPYLPTLPAMYDGMELESGSIWIYSQGPEDKGIHAEAIIEFMQTFYPNELIGDRTETIDGYPARRITFLLAPHTGFGNTESMVIEDILFNVDGVYYRIQFHIAESNRFGLFGIGFDDMVGSIQVVP